MKNIMFSLRYILTGKTNGFDLFSIMELLGKDEVINRLNNFLKQHNKWNQ